MAPQQLRGVLLSDFNAGNLAALLESSPEPPPLTCHTAPFGQVMQVLADPADPCWDPRPDFAVVWTRPEAVLPSFGALLEYRQVPLEALLEEVTAYAGRLAVLQERVRFAFIPTWVVPTAQRGYGILDMRNGIGLANTLHRLNLCLADALEQVPNAYLMDARRWIEAAGRQAFVPKLWYMGKIPFGPEVFKAARRDIQAGLLALSGAARKLLVLDLDDTLWGGIVGDVGWENLMLGGHDPQGEAFVDFQHALKALTHRGILLGIVSKNTESVALGAIGSHPEMVLRQGDFAGWRINWEDKAQNIIDLAADLNLGLQSVVFIDDNPVERDRVRATLPEVLVPEWPEDKTLYKDALLGLSCFESASVSREDRERARMYTTERERTALRLGTASVDDWLASLEMRVRVDPLDEASLPRAAQLLNKTNQMNLSTRRLTEGELREWARGPGRGFYTIRVADRFGDAGLTGLLGLEVEDQSVRIVDYVLSCRVMGRKVEEAMAALAVRFARDQGASEVIAHYQATAKNAPCLEFWRRSGFEGDSSGQYRWAVAREYPVPGALTLEGALR